MTSTDCAIVYVATGQRFVDEAVQSLRSLRRQMPQVKVVLHTDRGTTVSRAEFDQIEFIDSPQFSEIDKTWCCRGVRERRLIFLDTDTHVAAPLDDVFEMLSRFEVVYSHAPWRVSWDRVTRTPWHIPGVPDAFAEPNTGVIGMQNTPDVLRMLDRWRELHAANKRSGSVMHDQPAFRQAVWESGLQTSVLAPEYNARLVFPAFLSGEVKVIHARFSRMEEVAQRVNANHAHRVFNPYDKTVYDKGALERLATPLGQAMLSLKHAAGLSGQVSRQLRRAVGKLSKVMGKNR